MVSVEEASRIVFSNLWKCLSETVGLEDSIGRVLAETVHADRDFPPFDRVSMDGIAIQFDSWTKGLRSFAIENIQAAGEPQKVLSNSSNCIEVMTGSILPTDSDTVIRYEDLDIKSHTAFIKSDVIRKGQNVHPTGADVKADEILLKPGMFISPAEIALLASVGKSKVKVYSFPKAAIISSGDELVGINDLPLQHQIRSSNVFAIKAAMQQMHWSGQMTHLPDNREVLHAKLSQLLEANDVLILSGGVSKGKFDFIPEVLEGVGITKLFHQVNQRPGKPFWFGVTPAGKTIFALPGNPVSTFMCFYKYVKPWILKSMGVHADVRNASLESDFSFVPSVTFFLQVSAVNVNGHIIANPKAGGGSGDFANLKDVTGFLELPADKQIFKAGEEYPYIAFRQ